MIHHIIYFEEKSKVCQIRQHVLSRIVLVISAILAVLAVEVLRLSGFSVADLAFSIYGAALGLVPAILFSLFVSREKLKLLGSWAIASIILGFASAWISAFYGKITGNGNLVFLAPLFGFFISAIILSIGWAVRKKDTSLSI